VEAGRCFSDAKKWVVSSKLVVPCTVAVPVAIPPFMPPPPVIPPPNPLKLGVFEPGGVVIGKGISEGQMFVSNLYSGGVRVIDVESGEVCVLVSNNLYLQRLAKWDGVL
jgi:hypothetical protein